jgi:hypothetical protein
MHEMPKCVYFLDPRPDEGNGTTTTDIQESKEQNYTSLRLSTEIEITKTFTTPGQLYEIHLEVKNMHTVDATVLYWLVECGQPIVPSDWTLTYDPFMHSTKYFNITFSVKPNVPLPTKVRRSSNLFKNIHSIHYLTIKLIFQPTLRLYPVTGERLKDSIVSVNISIPIVFVYHKWQSGKGVPDCTDKHDKACLKDLTMESMGYNYSSGVPMQSDLDGNMGAALYGSSITISVPVPFIYRDQNGDPIEEDTNPATVYGFSVQFNNPISDIKTGASENNLTILDEVLVLDPLPNGSGEWVNRSWPKWEANWVR